MAIARLEVEIGAEIKDFQSKLAKSLKNLDLLKREQRSLSDAFKDGTITSKRYYDALARNSSTLKKTTADVSSYRSQIGGLGKGMGKLGKGTANAVPAMTSFSQVIQDAPYGIQGVANNIQQLTMQFGYLSTKSGGATGAIKGMVKSLAGPAGILLAVSLVTSLLVSYGDQLFSSGNKAKKLKKDQDKLTKSLEDYEYALEAVAQANLQGQKDATKEIVNLSLLSKQLNNTSLSLSDRKDAIQELRDKYPKYLKDMTDEKLLNGGLATVYDTLTKSILKRAKATASMNAIVKNSEQLLIIESKLKAKQNEITKQKLVLDKKDTAANRRRKSGGLAAEFEKLNKLKKESIALEGQLQSLELSNIDLEQNIDVITVPVKIKPDKASKDNFVNEVVKGYKKGKEEVQELVETDPITIAENLEFASINWEEYFKLKDFDAQALTLKEKMLKFNEDLKSIVDGSITNTFAGIGRAIGDAMSNGTSLAAGLGAALLGGIGSMATQLGQLAVATGVAILGIKLSLKSLNPALAIAGGIALIALGSAVSSSASKIGSSSGGSGMSNASSGSGSSTSRGSSSSSSRGSSSNNSLQNVVFEIQGTKLVGVLSNTLSRNKSLGGSLSLT
tara:strand:+ start:1154 stop:3007 length:1854 start_codon:yes stop_codon:yes gene_type:complete